MDKDAKQMKPSSEGVIYHFQFHRASMLSSLFASRKSEKNEYTDRFFPNVLRELRLRGLVQVQEFPAIVRRGNSELYGSKWTRSVHFLPG